MPRRFITRTDIDALADAGQSDLLVDEMTTVTDTAREHARDRGVRIVREPAGAPPSAEPRETAPADGDLEATVRAAVIARLGHAPDRLDAVVHRVLAEHT